MSKTYTPKRMGVGLLGSSPGVIFLCPPGKSAFVHFANFVNVSDPTSSQTVVVYHRRTESLEIGRSVLAAAGWRFELLSSVLQLEAGDQILAKCSDDGAVDFVVTGVLEGDAPEGTP